MPAEHEFDHVCAWCGLVTAGPHAGQQVAPTTNEIEGNRAVSHGVCPDCMDRQLTQYRAMTQRRLIEQEKAALRNREVPDEPVG